jgi:hypothetical protein
MLFAAAGYQVRLYDVEPSRVTAALEDILIRLEGLNKAGLLRGSLSVTQQHQRISAADSLADCIKDVKYVQVRQVTSVHHFYILKAYILWPKSFKLHFISFYADSFMNESAYCYDRVWTSVCLDVCNVRGSRPEFLTG